MNTWSSRTKKLPFYFNDYVDFLHRIEQWCQQDGKGVGGGAEWNPTFELPNYHFFREMKIMHSHHLKQMTPTVDVHTKQGVIAQRWNDFITFSFNVFLNIDD